MKNFQPKRGFKDIVQSKPVLVFLFIILMFFAYGVVGFFNKMRVTKENREMVENKVLELEEKKIKLSSDIEKLKTDQGVEESIREKFGLVKDGEGVIVVVEDKNKIEVPKKEPDGFFSRLFFWKN